MISVDEARVIIDQSTHEADSALLSLKDAFGLVTSKDVIADYDIPAYAQSSMDGYAFQFSDREFELSIIGEMKAGTNRRLSIKNNEATRIFTGAPLPDGADTVVMQEKSLVVENKLRIQDAALQKGMYVRMPGAEIRKGDVACPKNFRLTVAALGFLAGIGVKDVPVYARPRVSVILTGNELQTQGTALTFGKVFDANSVSLHLALKACGMATPSLYKAEDNIDVTRDAIQLALDSSEIVLVTGGVSVGDYDFVTRAAELCGVETRFHKIKQRPGKPLYFGTKERKLVFGLPGNPSSALTCFYMYVLPAIDKMLHTSFSCKIIHASLSADFVKVKSLTQFVKAYVEGEQVTILNAQESFRLHSFARANALVELAEDRDRYTAGEKVKVHLLPT